MKRYFKNNSIHWPKDLNAEMDLFLSVEAMPPSGIVSTRILSQVGRKLNPSPSRTFSKLMGIHLLTLGLTLLICPQLGLGPWGGGSGLMGWVMPLGSRLCACFCGSFLFASTAILGQLLLTAEECRLICRTKIWQFPALTTASFFLLMLFRQVLFDFSLWPSLDYLLIWFLAGVAGALFSFVSLQRLRLSLVKGT